jgi:histidinol dehydrogenase
MKTYNNPNKSDWESILARPVKDARQLEETVSLIFNEVKTLGDKAVKKYTKFFDRVEVDELLVSEAEFLTAEKLVDDNLKSAIKIAKSNIEKFHKSQVKEVEVIETFPGVNCWRKSVPIEKVGLYIPGGTAPLFSTVLMLGIPAKIANCDEVIICTPPDKNGEVNPAILYTVKLVGIEKVYKVGGIQAISAMTYGTNWISKVYKIFGPGNQYVTEAKKMAVREGVAVDMPAGPSEVLVVADSTADPDFIAADLLSQAEHGADSQVLFVSWENNLINAVQDAVLTQVKSLDRKEVAEQALANSKLVLVKDELEAIELVNFYAPEHLIIAVENEDFFTRNLKNAGSVFLGNFTPESAGDYASGTNHTLPTNGFAKAYSGVSVESFTKQITFQRISEEGLQELGPVITTMAEAEMLQAHSNAVKVRLQKLAPTFVKAGL